jgi:hypothetical protein
MTSTRKQAVLTCLECGQAIPDGQRWLCSARCAAVMKLVRYGRKHAAGEDPDETGLDDALLHRYRGQAGIVGRFPTQSLLDKVRGRDRRRCQYQGCDATGAAVDYREDDPDLIRRPRADDLRTLCPSHHKSESRRRFVRAHGRIAHTAPATLARIESLEPLVLRDDQWLWDNPANLRFLRAWPLASKETRGDLERMVVALREVPDPPHPSQGDDLEDPFVKLNAAIAKLNLLPRRELHLVRATDALILAHLVDEEADLESSLRSAARMMFGDAALFDGDTD